MTKLKIHPTSDVQSKFIGDSTVIWQYCVVLPNAHVGARCNICANVFIENDVVIGDDVTIKNGVQIWDGVRIGDGVFIGPNATFTNDSFPRSKQYPPYFHLTTVGAGASIGANATILPGITIGSNAMIGAGAVVNKNVPSNAIVVGNPGVISGYVGVESLDKEVVEVDTKISYQSKENLGVKGCHLYTLTEIPDLRGTLSVAEYERNIPFVPKRLFWVFDVPSKQVRGEHAHKVLHQYLICVRGSVSIVLDDGVKKTELILNKPNLGLYIPPLIWGIQYKYSADAVLLVIASEVYDSNDYIRDYGEFLAYVAS